MAKKTPVKKSKRGLKRSVRRSLSAVLMITAIGVAAIPVPENYAVSEGIQTYAAVEDKHTSYSYNELKTGKVGGDGANISDKEEKSRRSLEAAVESFKYDPNKSNKGILDVYYDEVLSKVSESNTADNLDKDFSGSLYKSLKVTDQRGRAELTWEYKFYTNNANVIVCDYNDNYPTGSLDLDTNRFPILEYFNVPVDIFNEYFRSGFTEKKISNYLTLQMDEDPTQVSVSYTYEQYKRNSGIWLEELTNYAPSWLADKQRQFADYKAGEDAWIAEDPGVNTEQQYEQDHPIPGDDSTPGTFKATMSEAIGSYENYRTKYFQDKCSTLQDYGTGYNLTPVSDTRETTPDPPTIYVAQGGTAKGRGVDIEGYLVVRQFDQVTGIGKQAFADVVNVTSIILPENIQYIADEAFIRSSSITGVDIDNAEIIGNKAFQSCSNLTTVKLGSNVRTIGVEAFQNCIKLTAITFSPNTRMIGAGAFADCIRLATLNLNDIQYADGAEIGPAAFYNCQDLSTVNISNSTVSKIGDSAFATTYGDVMTEFVFPAMQNSSDCLDDRLFSGRAMLQYVTFPANYGRGASVKIPDNMFHECGSLAHVVFPTNEGADAYACGYATYNSEILFADVGDKNFYVTGPELTRLNGDYAGPRQSTWDAVTGYYTEKGYVPYHFYDKDGAEYYEICNGYYLLSIRKNADGTGTLVRCVLKDPNNKPMDGELIIPDTVGDTVVTAIDTNCFSDTDLTSSVGTLVINDYIKMIADSTFENTSIGGGQYKWEKLRAATIGSAVESIGANAFLNCDKLVDITFKTPADNDYTKLKLGNNALKTNGAKLTIHGDIHSGYSPFDYAVSPFTYVKDSNDGIRVCYQSRWDSPESKHMTVMYGDSNYMSAAGKTGYVTLVDYPKYSELDELVNSDELQEHNEERVQQFYNEYASDIYDSRRLDFTKAWIAGAEDNDLYKNGADGFTVGEDGISQDPLYGPWINEDFCDNWSWWVAEAKGEHQDKLGSKNGNIFDWLFEPIIAQAATTSESNPPEAYFAHYQFNFMENYKRYNGSEMAIPRLSDGTFMDYLGWNDFEKGIVSSVEDIVIPAGVESIDISDFRDNNRTNYLKYNFSIYDGKEPEPNSADTVVPGLFSGLIEDYDTTDEQGKYETRVRGNDRIKSVTMTSVLYLPDYSFDNCERLESVTLGDAMESVGALPFRDCFSLVNLTGNAKYPAENGILYETQDGEEEAYKIIECLMARGNRSLSPSDISELRVVSDASDPKLAFVNAIAESAFEDCKYITYIDLGSATSLKEIADGTFKDCVNLTTIMLPKSVNNILDYAFAGVGQTYDESEGIKCTIVIPGSEVSISDDAFGRLTDYPKGKNHILIRALENTAAARYAQYYVKEGMEFDAIDASEATYTVTFIDYDGTVIDIKYVVNSKVETPDTTELEKSDHRPGYRFADKWIGTNGQDIDQVITADCTFIAQYESDGTMVNGQYVLEFRDGIDGRQLNNMYANREDGKYYITPGTSFMSNGWEVPPYYAHDGYEFLAWSNNWTENTVIDSNMTIIALYSADPNGGSGGSSGVVGGSSGTTQTPGTTSNKSSSNTSTSSSSTSTSSTTSGSSEVGKYTVTVENGSGSGSYDVGSTVIIAANTAPAGMVFKNWTTESNGVALASVSMTATTFTMPANNVTVTANYVTATPTAANTGSTGSVGNTGNTGNTGNRDNGSTRVDITKPGISNKDLATANTNGSTDNFVVKITETDEATRAVADALTNKYGSLENILYYAMDISLYDSTGTVKISDTSGLSVDITIPIPDALVAYGGNNMAGAVINGNQLENLNENFTTINGVPCIRFTATHFSPYTIYVDTGNLTEGMLDVTPKTGDPIHPKWFLSIGLACLSVILFMKKDKAVKVKTA